MASKFTQGIIWWWDQWCYVASGRLGRDEPTFWSGIQIACARMIPFIPLYGIIMFLVLR